MTGSRLVFRMSVGLLALTATVAAQRQAPASPATPDIELLPVQGNVSAIFTRDGNVIVQAGPAGGVLVDTGTAAVSTGPIRSRACRCLGLAPRSPAKSASHACP